MPGSTCGKTNESTVKTKENRVFVDGYLGTSNHRMFFIYGIDPNIAITFPIYIYIIQYMFVDSETLPFHII